MLKKSTKIGVRSLEWIISLLLVAFTVSVFSPSLKHEFVSFDDDMFIYENPFIQEGLTWKSLQWAFTADLLTESPNADFWIPLTFLSHILTIEFYGMDPAGHHLVNVLLHGLNTVLLFLVLHRMTGGLWASACVAGLFGVHPLHVESVAWVTERKDVLSTLFWFLTMGAYLRYVEQSKMGRYVWVVVCLGLGLMAKPMLITLPFVLLLLDYWPLRRISLENLEGFRHLIWEKVPLFILVGLSIVITYNSLQGGGHVLTIEKYTLWTRIENALVSYTDYMGKMFWPTGLAVFYPHPGGTIPLWKVLGAVLVLAGITAWVVWEKKQKPYLLMGWLWYVGTLVPTLGLVQAGYHGIADRYTYIPLIGLFIMAAWGMWDLTKKLPYQRMMISGTAGLIFPALMACTWFQVQNWENTIVLFKHNIMVTEKNYLAHHNLGYAYEKGDRINEAIQEYKTAIKIKPDFALSHYNLGFLYQKQGRLDESIEAFENTLALKPNLPVVHFLLGNVYYQQGELNEAIQAYQKALALTPNSPGTHNNLGMVYGEMGQMDMAIREFKIALELYPQFPEAQKNLENALKAKEN